MQIEQRCWDATGSPDGSASLNGSADLVLVFGPAPLIGSPAAGQWLRDQYPSAHLLGCSTAGDIHRAGIHDRGLSITAIDFEKTAVKPARMEVASPDESYVAGQRLAEALWSDDLVHVMLLLNGVRVNGTELTKGLSHALPDSVTVTGGLAAGRDNNEPIILLDGPIAPNSVAAFGFYGKDLNVACGTGGAWEPFSREHVVTRARGDLLLELDGRPALEVYEQAVGECSSLPTAGLHFPLSVRTHDPTQGIVRTAVQVDRDRQALRLGGDVPQDSFARLMRSTGDRLVEGAALAADTCCSALQQPPQLALLVSCVARRGVLKQRTGEEIEAVRDVVGPATLLAGFYGLGEIAPAEPGGRAELHNQTMSVTGFSEN